MKKQFLIALCCFIPICMGAQNTGETSVKNFGNNLSRWCLENDIDYRNAAAKECAGDDGDDCVVYDSLMMEFERRGNRELLKKYRLSRYFSGFQSAISQGSGINVSIKNIRPLTNFRFDNTSLGDNKRNSFYFVSGDVNVSGSMNYISRDVFYIRKGSGRISQIAPVPYHGGRSESLRRQEDIVINTSDIKDWDHIAEGEFNSIELSYGYSCNFPLNIGVSTNFSYFNIGVDYGMNFSEEQLDFKKHTNYATSSLERGKYWYLMATPGVYFRWVTVDCSLGNVFAKYIYNYESVYTTSSNSEKENYFAMKPKVTFHIPIPFDFSSRTEKLYISPHVGYMYVPKCSTLNCWEVGIGVRLRFY